ncbi:hypothetical protein [Streptomyces sp. NPDC051162]|uniref:hypothetical protein n=1 Tax=unclassified Streptomyces TaxID=2593676 RepID=UPI003416876E
MTKLMLSLHVLAALILIGPATVAASLFPRYARQALGADGGSELGALRLLHRVTRVYAAASVAVPAFGVATAGQMGVMGDTWLIASMALTALAAFLLVLAVFTQDAVMEALDKRDESALATARAALPRLAMVTGMFSLAWAVVTVLMIIRPGSTTGA